MSWSPASMILKQDVSLHSEINEYDFLVAPMNMLLVALVNEITFPQSFF